MTDVINLDQYRNLKKEDTFKETVTVDLMREMVRVLLDYGYDPTSRLTAENMIIVTMMFKAHLDHLDGIDNEMYDMFSVIKGEFIE